jgi:hypothetical protein
MYKLAIDSTAAAALGVALAFGVVAHAAPIIYPSKGQSQKQQQKDEGECYTWSKNKTGVDPAAVAAAPVPPSGPAVGGGERTRGAIKGAVVGGIIDGGDGAGKGAALGVVAGGSKARSNQRDQQASGESQKQGAMDTFSRANAACMEGRGYQVK